MEALYPCSVCSNFTDTPDGLCRRCRFRSTDKSVERWNADFKRQVERSEMPGVPELPKDHGQPLDWVVPEIGKAKKKSR